MVTDSWRGIEGSEEGDGPCIGSPQRRREQSGSSTETPKTRRQNDMVEIHQPEWRVKGRRCPCACGGEGALVFISCPSCGQISLICDEVGTVFPNPRDLDKGPLLSGLIDLSDDIC